MKCDRAKIFASFNPLNGLDRALREKENERLTVAKKETAEDRQREIDYKLNNIKIGDLVNVSYYADGQYKTLKGTVSGFSKEKCCFTVIEQIPFDDIYDIEIASLDF